MLKVFWRAVYLVDCIAQVFRRTVYLLDCIAQWRSIICYRMYRNRGYSPDANRMTSRVIHVSTDQSKVARLRFHAHVCRCLQILYQEFPNGFQRRARSLRQAEHQRAEPMECGTQPRRLGQTYPHTGRLDLQQKPWYAPYRLDVPLSMFHRSYQVH